ncbi:MAG: UDP-N-acetylmuramoyl-tripeptide--D-alanyl-D-alanine ligase, partial [Actinomycetota bacterium]|nr:UDP-N-acetylmuramoyl-tripeptide--D-alanyl-D-alanine ligase [Actinomycetota bacterium]
MGRAEPFAGYSWVLRFIIYVLVPAFTAWQYVRLRRAFHVFQMESYKPHWFRDWVKGAPRRSLFLSSFQDAKKPLVMTGRAWRTIVLGTALTAFGILVPSGIVHVSFGTPWDLITCAVMFGLMFLGVPQVLLLADRLLTPVQRAINNHYIKQATAKLQKVAPVVVGVTGSYGKTSTKFAIAKVLGASRKVLATPASFNTPLGVARTINELLEPQHDVFVVEMGARREGDIAEIVGLVRPSIGVLTAIGPAHLESFGSLDAIRRTKYEIVATLEEGGTAVMNVDDGEVRALADTTTGKVVRYGLDPEGTPDITASDVSTRATGTTMRVIDTRSNEHVEVSTRLLGRHAVGHVLAGAAVASALGLPLEDLGDSIAQMEPVEHRLQIIEGAGGVVVIDDAYNSNPDGATAALEVLEAMPGGKKIVITPGMVELGTEQYEANAEFGRRAAEVADVVIAVAAINRDALLEGAERAGAPQKVIAV